MIIDDAVQQFMIAQVDQILGPVPDGVDPAPIEAFRQKLALCIAAAVSYVRDNAVVAQGIPVTTNTGTGQTTAPGKLS